MYVLQEGQANHAFANLKYGGSNSGQSSQAQLAQQHSQAQFFSRSGEAQAQVGSTGPHQQQQQIQQSQIQQHGSVPESASQQQQSQTLSAAIKQQQYQASLDTQAIQAAVEAVQQLEAQQQGQSQVHQPLQNAAEQQQAIQQGQQQQLAALLAQQSAPSQTVVLPQGAASLLASGGATAQEILAATQAAANGQVSAQYIQIQPSQEQPLQLQYPAADQFSERQQQYQGQQQQQQVAAAYPASATQFVIQPQTYLAGANGQTFTVPVPVPVEQASQQQQQLQQHQQQQGRLHLGGGGAYQQQQYQGQQQHPSQQQQFQQQQYLGQNQNQQGQNGNRQGPQGHQQGHHQGQNPNQSSLSDRMKHAFSQNFNRKMLERVETNAVVPALASTGLFLGLSALAAGWYLSKSNREVGIVRRTGKFSKKKGIASPAPASSQSVSLDEEIEYSANTRTRRDLASMITPRQYSPGGGVAPEVDQATFFQSIIQQSLEKTQQNYDEPGSEPVYQDQNQYQGQGQQDAGPYHRGDPEPERHSPPPGPPGPPPSRFRSGPKYNNRHDNRPSKYYREESDYYDGPANSRISKGQVAAQEKSGWSVHSAKNFARVAIPAVVLTGAALGICAVIFGWYISGDNREIAFLESPTTNSIGQGYGTRRKRALFGNPAPAVGTAWSDGWLIRTLKAIHGNPYDNMPAPTAKSFIPYPYFLDKDSSKTSTLEFKVSNNGLAGVLAGGAVLAVVALGLINSFSESTARSSKSSRLLTSGASGAKLTSTNPLTHLRSPRNMFEKNQLGLAEQQSPSFFENILSSLESSGGTIMTKMEELGKGSTWQQSSCTKRVLCQLISGQGDDTVRLMEKKMAAVLKMLPDSISSSIKKNYSDVLSGIYKRDCKAFTCSTQKKPALPKVEKSKPRRDSLKTTSQTSSHSKKASIRAEQTNAQRR